MHTPSAHPYAHVHTHVHAHACRLFEKLAAIVPAQVCMLTEINDSDSAITDQQAVKLLFPYIRL
jgi:hypothetical protein